MDKNKQASIFTSRADAPAGRVRARRRLKAGLAILAGLLVVGLAGVAVLRGMMTRAGRVALESAVQALAPRAAFTFQRMALSRLGRRVVLERCVIQPAGGGPAATLERLVLEGLEPGCAFPRRLRLEARGLDAPAAALAGLRRTLKRMGYERLSGDIVLECAYDRGAATLAIGRLDIRLRDAGRLWGSGVIAGFGERDLAALLSQPGAVDFGSWSLVRGELVYQDDGLAKRFLTYQAREIGETLAQLRYGMSSDLEETIRTEPDDFTRASLRQFRGFIANLTYLEMKAAPGQPASLAALEKAYGRDGLKGLITPLGLTFSSHRPAGRDAPAR